DFIPTQLLSSLLTPRPLPPPCGCHGLTRHLRVRTRHPEENPLPRLLPRDLSRARQHHRHRGEHEPPLHLRGRRHLRRRARIGPSKWSTEVGRAQGVSFHVSQRDESSLIPPVLVFTAGNFCDSTLTVIGRMDASGKADRAIVGGTGVFQFASWNVVSKLVTFDDAGLVAAFDVYGVYYDDVRLSAIG
ncbi:unnamed protein product, partial [Musa acuminata subsp. burmannicoides]